MELRVSLVVTSRQGLELEETSHCLVLFRFSLGLTSSVLQSTPTEVTVVAGGAQGTEGMGGVSTG